VYKNADGSVILGIYVDDMIILADSDRTMSDFKSFITSKFDIKDLGPISSFVGLQISRDYQNNCLYIDQSAMIQNLCDRFDLSSAKPAYTPVSSGFVWQPEDNDKPMDQNLSYMQLVGSLLYIANMSRPDAMFTASMLCRFMHKPYAKHMNAARRLAIYLKTNIDLKLKYTANKSDPVIYCDSDFGNVNNNMKSITGIITMYNNNCISWSSSLQTTIATCTAEAELTSIRDACKEAIFFRNFISNLTNSNSSPIQVWNDNSAAIALAKQGGRFTGSKHYRLKVAFVRECLELKDIILDYKPTSEMLADILTKALGRHQHELLVSGLGFTHESPHPSSAS
jgi:hypothetical protein